VTDGLRNGSAAIVIATLLVGCGGTGANRTTTGVVIDVTGDLATVDDFVVRLPDGADQTIEPAPGIGFGADTAIGHLRDHLRSGAPVRIEYEVLDDGRWVALSIEDAAG